MKTPTALLLGMLFSFVCFHGIFFGMFGEEGILTSAFITVMVFLPHELAHISVGRGKYVFSPLLSILSLLCAYLKFPFILTGYAEVDSLKGVVAGPLANIVMALSALIVSYWDRSVFILVYPNVWYAASNLLPFPPLDGATIVREKPFLWLAMFVPVLAIYLMK
jgi:Zn-dependent protease